MGDERVVATGGAQLRGRGLHAGRCLVGKGGGKGGGTGGAVGGLFMGHIFVLGGGGAGGVADAARGRAGGRVLSGCHMGRAQVFWWGWSLTAAALFGGMVVVGRGADVGGVGSKWAGDWVGDAEGARCYATVTVRGVHAGASCHYGLCAPRTRWARRNNRGLFRAVDGNVPPRPTRRAVTPPHFASTFL